MATLLGTLLATLLTALAVLHALWALGLSFPFPNEQTLARSVVGRRGITRLPSRAAVGFLAILLLAAAIAACLMGFYPADLPRGAKLMLLPVGLFLAGVFLLRSIVGVLPPSERAAPEQPYLSLNRRIYSPLSALIGIGFLILSVTLPNWAWRLGQTFGLGDQAAGSAVSQSSADTPSSPLAVIMPAKFQ